MMILVAIVIIGGIKRIGAVAEKIVPAMAILYVLAALAIILLNAGQVPAAIGKIFAGAFTGAGIAGGVVGALIQGFRRAAFSNEAGVGSAAIAHSAVRTDHPASEGVVALLEPFVDTVVICTMTALVIIIMNMDGSLITYGSDGGLGGVTLTSMAFNNAIPGSSYILTLAVILFARTMAYRLGCTFSVKAKSQIIRTKFCSACLLLLVQQRVSAQWSASLML